MGDSLIKWWNILYFVNDAVLITGILLILRGYFDTPLIDSSILLSNINTLFNIIVAIDEKFAEKVNSCFWVCLVIVVFLTSFIIFKCRKK